MIENLVLVVHIVIGLAIIGLILLQQGKGAEMGASFGAGSSQTLFGAAGSGNFFSHLTGIFAAIFFVTSLSLAVIAKKQSSVGTDLGLDLDHPALEESAIPQADVVESDLPVVESAPSEENDLPAVEAPATTEDNK